MVRLPSKQGKSCRVGVSMEIDIVDKAKEEPHLSGAYIRSLVKHLTSTKTKDSSIDGGSTESLSDVNNGQQQRTPPPQHKKQVRRRLHTSKPYQERLLNMAEARREIVTALKFHRASMAANSNNKDHLHSSQIQPQLDQSPPIKPSLKQEFKLKSKRNPRLYPSSTATATTNYLDPYLGLPYPPQVPYFWPISTIAPPPLPHMYQENLNFPLPNQTLGLNLNFQDFNFNNLETNLYHKYPSSSSSSSTSSSSPSSSSSVTISVPANASGEGVGDVGGNGLYHAMDDEEMEEIKSLGEQHQMEWNDTINLVTSARWCKFLKTMEIGAEEGATKEDDEYHAFDQVMEFPPWLINANESYSSLQQHFDDHFSDACLQDPALPCMDIGEIEGMDGEWLA